MGGLTLFLAVLSDLLSLFLTAHLRIAYEFSRMVYWGAGVQLGGGLLWGVFRGMSIDVLPVYMQLNVFRKEAKRPAETY